MSVRLARRRNQSARGRALLGATGAMAFTGLLAVAATAPAQAAAASGSATPHREWQPVYSTHGGPSQAFDYVVAPARNDAWAAGGNFPATAKAPVFAYWNGRTWNSVRIKAAAGFDFGLPADVGPLAYASAPGNVWFFGEKTATRAPEALVYDGKKWQAKSLPPDFEAPLAVVGPHDVWAESTETCAAFPTDGCTVLLHWNGATWTRGKIAGIRPVASTAGQHAWIMTIADGNFVPASGKAPYGQPIIHRTTGARLATVVTPGRAVITQDEDGIGAAPDGRIWFISGDALIRFAPPMLYSWTGHKWVGSAIPTRLCSPGVTKPCWFYPEGVNLSYDGRNGFWAGPYARWTGSKWINIGNGAKALAKAGLYDVAVIPGTGSAWGAGAVLRTAKSTATNALIAVYGPLP